MSLESLVTLLQTALTLLTLVASNPDLAPLYKDSALTVAHSAITQATVVLSSPRASEPAPSVIKDELFDSISVTSIVTSTPPTIPSASTSSPPQSQSISTAVPTPAQTQRTRSCTTPSGGAVVADGQYISSQPYFTNGRYSASVVVAKMLCSNGSWKSCDWTGNNCRDWSPPSSFY